MKVVINDVSYVQVAECSAQKLIELYDKCRGLETKANFAKKINSNSFERLRRKLKNENEMVKSVKTESFESVLSNACPDANVTMNEFMAAAGFLKEAEIKRILDTLKPPKKDVKDFRFTENRLPDDRTTHFFDDTDYEKFVDNLTYFTALLSEEKLVKKINFYKSRFFTDKGICFMLERFRSYSEQEERDYMYKTASYFCQDDANAKIELNHSLRDNYFRVLVDLLIKKTDLYNNELT